MVDIDKLRAELRDWLASFRDFERMLVQKADLCALLDHIDRLEAECLLSANNSASDFARAEAAEAELQGVSNAIATVEFLDPPDGGDVPLAVQVRRMKRALDEARAELARLRAPVGEVGEMVKRLQDAFENCVESPTKHISPADLSTVLDLITRLAARVAEGERVIDPFARISSDGVITVQTGHVTVTTCAEYFHEANAYIQKDQTDDCME